MNQLFKVTVDGVVVTEQIESFNATVSIGSVYTTGTLEVSGINPALWIEKTVLIEYGDATCNGFVYSFTKSGQNSYSVHVRSASAKLAEPYASSTPATDEASTSKALMNLYSDRYGVAISHQCADLDFGGSYERNGTPLDVIRTLANVTGAEFYCNDNGLIIEPMQGIQGSGTIIEDDEYFDFAVLTDSVYNKGVGEIFITNGSKAETSIEVLSEARIYAEMDEYTGDLWIFTNPKDTLDKHSGMYFPSGVEMIGTIDKTQELTLAGEQVITLDAAIASITSVTVNGYNVSNYEFGQGFNKLWFSSQIYGNVIVIYSAYFSRAVATTEQTPDGNFAKVEMFYKDQYLLMSKLLQVNNSGEDSAVVNCRLYTESRGYKGSAVVFDAVGETPLSIVLNADAVSGLVYHSEINGIAVYTRGSISPWFSTVTKTSETRRISSFGSFDTKEGAEFVAVLNDIEDAASLEVYLAGGLFIDYRIKAVDGNSVTLATDNAIAENARVEVTHLYPVDRYSIEAAGDSTACISIAVLKCGSTSIIELEDGDGTQSSLSGDKDCAMFYDRDTTLTDATTIGVYGANKLDIVMIEDAELSTNRVLLHTDTNYDIYGSGDIGTAFIAGITEAAGTDEMRISLTFDDSGSPGGTGTTSEVPDPNLITVFHGSTELIQDTDYTVVSNTGGVLTLSTGLAILENQTVSIFYDVATNKITLPALGVDHKTTLIELFICTFSGDIRISRDGSSGEGLGAEDNVMSCIMPNGLNYVIGFDFRTVGGTPDIEFYLNEVEIARSVITASETYTHKERATLEKIGDEYFARPRLPIISAAGARSFGNDIAYTMDLSEDGSRVFKFSKFYPEVEILYTVDAQKHTVQFVNEPSGTVTMSVLNTDTGRRCSNELQGQDDSDMETIPCSLPVDLPIDLPRELNCTVAEAAGQDITNASLGTFTADEFGVVVLSLAIDISNGDYEFDTAHIKNRTKLVFKLNI